MHATKYATKYAPMGAPMGAPMDAPMDARVRSNHVLIPGGLGWGDGRAGGVLGGPGTTRKTT